jgi:hypothetical protein
MKLQTRIILTLFIIGSFSLVTATVGCKKSNSSSSGSGTITANVSGVSFASSATTSQAIYSSAYGQFDIVGAQVKGGDTTLIDLSWNAAPKLNFPISSDTSLMEISYFDSKTQAAFDGSDLPGHSIITITSWDSTNLKVAGTWSGVMYGISATDSIVVTNGTFNTTYIKQ